MPTLADLPKKFHEFFLNYNLCRYNKELNNIDINYLQKIYVDYGEYFGGEYYLPPLFYAIKENNIDIFNALLELGADQGLCPHHYDPIGQGNNYCPNSLLIIYNNRNKEMFKKFISNIKVARYIINDYCYMEKIFYFDSDPKYFTNDIFKTNFLGHLISNLENSENQKDKEEILENYIKPILTNQAIAPELLKTSITRIEYYKCKPPIAFVKSNLIAKLLIESIGVKIDKSNIIEAINQCNSIAFLYFLKHESTSIVLFTHVLSSFLSIQAHNQPIFFDIRENFKESCDYILHLELLKRMRKFSLSVQTGKKMFEELNNMVDDIVDKSKFKFSNLSNDYSNFIKINASLKEAFENSDEFLLSSISGTNIEMNQICDKVSSLIFNYKTTVEKDLKNKEIIRKDMKSNFIKPMVLKYNQILHPMKTMKKAKRPISHQLRKYIFSFLVDFNDEKLGKLNQELVELANTDDEINLNLL